MNPSLRLTDISNRIIAIAPAHRLHSELEAIAARSMGIVPQIRNQSEEANPTELSPTRSGGGFVQPAANYQDVFENEPHYVRGLSKAVL